MDAAGLLKKQGWRGLGHSLDNDNKGLRKPLLVSKKVDVLGIGINKADVIQGQWWLKAFDSSLKDFGTGKKSILANVKDHGIKRGGLYGRFVQGEGVPGTIGVVDPKVAALASAIGPATGVKRKAENDEDEDKKEKQKAKKEKKRSKSTSESSSDDEKKARRAAKKAKKSATTDEDTSDAAATKKSKSKKDKSLDGLPEDKLKQYEERAASKGVTLEQYFTQRLAKNLEAKEARRSGTTTPATEPASEDSAKDDTKKEKKSKKDKKSSKK
ncbi:hypothetical protein E4T50_14132 [Aureobasidium sp. EXF-12298]|nr:hypothetical protein E4T50_14132 [Aureobasidium sp. EXF-12298]KAI4751751.1 hypothetical protein E4T51_15035 [Aureobasidium sp. EXF-12344]KAI4770542.1 hypothetical protein E4T52_14441 [Aureobasidium sp. EXF-3400]